MAENAPVLQEKMEQFQGQDIQKIVFDATDLVYLSSSGIRVITSVLHNSRRHPKIVMVNCARKIYDTLDIVGLTSFLSFEDDERKDSPKAVNADSVEDIWQAKIEETRQKQLDNFAAHNDVVMYQMKLGQTEE